jgi:hypothetical protein
MATAQNYQNHRQYIPLYHGLTTVLLVALLAWAVRGVIRSPSLDSAMSLLAAITLVLLFWYCRAFAMAVQNRVIRLEEQLRLTRVLPDDLKARIDELRLSHLIALRFAPDAELPGLVGRVLGGELTDQDAIKRAIRNWRPDYARA